MSSIVNSRLQATCLNNEPIGLPTVKSLTNFSLDLDAFVLLSLLFQFLLVLVAPWRKHSLVYLLPFIAVVYVEAISLANYAMGLVPDNTVQGGRTSDLRVYWAPFLILHLGGPNTISGLSLLDNELWLRYAAHLITLSYTFGRVFLHNFFLNNRLWVPTVFVFLAGLLKYTERVICLFSARLTKFRESSLPKPDPGENYARLMQTRTSFQNSANLPVEFRISRSGQVLLPSRGRASANNRLSQVQIVKEAYRLFQDFRGLFVSSVYTYDQRDKSRHYFLSRDAEEAFSICEVELNFAYDVFYTKAILISRTKWPIVNLATLLLQLVSLVLWFGMDKCAFRASSLYVTNALVYGSVALDLLSLLMFFTSDWNIAMVKQKNIDAKSLFSNYFCETMLLVKKRVREGHRRGCVGLNLFRRWSERIPQINLINFSVDKSLSSILRHWTAHVWFSDELRSFVFDELVTRSCSAQHHKDVEGLCSARGMWILTHLSLKYKDRGFFPDAVFGPWITDVEYEESLVLWHIATTLCYVLEDADRHREDHPCKLSRVLSDYMLHHLIRQPNLMIPPSPGIIGKIISLDTCAEAKLFFDRVLPRWNCFTVDKKKRLRSACEKMIQVNTDVVSPKQIRGDESKSVLFDGCILAKKLLRLDQDHGVDKWEIISKVWAEMLFYCAAHSSPTKHVEELRTGGDLLTLVWLLMAHLGLGKHFRYNKAKDTTAQLTIYGKH